MASLYVADFFKNATNYTVSYGADILMASSTSGPTTAGAGVWGQHHHHGYNTLQPHMGATTAATATTVSGSDGSDVSVSAGVGGENVTAVNLVPESLQTTRLVVQGVLTPIVVTVGLFGNLLNILVLFQPSMRTSTNVYLLVLSLADTLYLLLNIVLSQLSCSKAGLPLAAYQFNPYGRFISNFSGNVAVWITVVFTVERYLAVCHPIHGKVWCTVRRAKLASLAATMFVLINVLPTLFELEVVIEAVAAPANGIINTTAATYSNSISNAHMNSNTVNSSFSAWLRGADSLGLAAEVRASSFGARSDGYMPSLDIASGVTDGGNVSGMLTTMFTTPSLVMGASVGHVVNGGVAGEVSSLNLTEEGDAGEGESGPGYSVAGRPRCVDTELARRWSYEKGYSWWYVTVFAFVPLFFLAIFNTVLIRALILAGRRRQQMALISTSNAANSRSTPCVRRNEKLTKKEEKQARKEMKKLQNNCHDMSCSGFDGISTSQASNSHGSFHDTAGHSTVSLTHKRQTRRISREQNKVTLLLVTIVMIFILCQLPWTVLYLYKTCGPKMTKSSITHVKIAGNVCNLLSLINASVNFYLYSFFSKRFRRTLAKLVLCWRRKRDMSPTTV